MAQSKSITLASGIKRQLLFEQPERSVPGQIIHSGISLPLRQNDWWDIRELSRLPYYTLVMLLKDGSGFFRDESGYECQLEYGHFLLIPPGIKRLYGPGKNDKWSELSVAFVGPIFDLHHECGLFNSNRLVWYLKDPKSWVEKLRGILELPRPANEREIARETAHFLTFLLDMIEYATPVQKNIPPSDWFTQACVMLTRDLSCKVDMHQVAAELSMSYSTFRHYFTRRAGMPPSHYRDSQRIETACDLLQNTEKTHWEIAFNLGYSSEQHFSAHFKEWMKMPPRVYRHEQQKKNA